MCRNGFEAERRVSGPLRILKLLLADSDPDKEFCAVFGRKIGCFESDLFCPVVCVWSCIGSGEEFRSGFPVLEIGGGFDDVVDAAGADQAVEAEDQSVGAEADLRHEIEFGIVKIEPERVCEEIRDSVAERIG